MNDELLSLAQQTEDAPDFERSVLELLARRIGFDAAFFAVNDELPTTVAVDADHLSRAMDREDYASEILPLKRAAMARRGVVVDTEVLGERAVRKTAYHRELAAPIGGRHSLLAYLHLRGHFMGAVMLGRNGATFAANDVALVEDLLPALSVARASFGVTTMRPAPLPRDGSRASLRSLGDLVRGARTLARVPTGDSELEVRDRGAYREMVAGDFVWTRARHFSRARRPVVGMSS